MGFARRVVRKSVRKATPRPVRKAMHPVRTARRAVTPRPVRQVSRAVYTVTNPSGAAENKLIGAALNGGRTRSAGAGRSPTHTPPERSVQVSPGRAASGGGVRVAEAAASHDRIARLMAVQRQRFAPSRRPLVPDPVPVDSARLAREEWERQKGEVPFWRRAGRRRLRGQVREHARVLAANLADKARAAQQKQQAEADAWWTALNEGEPGVLVPALKAAFVDNPAPVAVISANGPEAILAVVLPGPDVLPARTAHVTPSVRLSRTAPSWAVHEACRDHGGRSQRGGAGSGCLRLAGMIRDRIASADG
jgi:hypothetical protein